MPTAPPAATITRATPHPFSAGAIARRADEAGYVHGLAAGHADGIAHLRPLILEARVTRLALRRQAARMQLEDPGRGRLLALAELHRHYIRALATAARALKEAPRV